MSRNIIITGSRGLLGQEVRRYFESKDDHVIEFDKTLGHDATNEEFVKEWFGHFKADYLINLFGMNDHVDESQKSNNLMDISLDSIRQYLDVNLVALFSVCREFARGRGWVPGGIVNFASLYGVVSPRPELYADQKHIGYGVSKAGVIQLGKHLSVHLAPYVKVNTIVCGGVEHQQSPEFKEKYSKQVPLQRMMKKDELNGLLNFLCSTDSSYSTGAVYTIDGGYTCV